jgi:L-threonylcarbamoyladenylate synthase
MKTRGLPKELLAEDGSIGIRLVKNDFCKKLITKLNKPLVSTLPISAVKKVH